MVVRLNAPDISCKSCAAAITNALSALDGVEQVQVDVAAKMVDLVYDESRLTLDQILQRLDDAGFPATALS